MDMDQQLRHTAGSGNVSQLRRLIRAGTDVNGQDKWGSTALIRAAAGGHVTACQELLRSGANAAQRHGSGWTALHGACSNGHVHIACLLARNGADVDARTQNNCNTPCHLAARQNHVAVLEEMYECGADWTLKNTAGRNVLEEALYYRNEDAAAVISRVLAGKFVWKDASLNALDHRSQL